VNQICAILDRRSNSELIGSLPKSPINPKENSKIRAIINKVARQPEFQGYTFLISERLKNSKNEVPSQLTRNLVLRDTK
jgi:hypothetical protein